MYQSHFLSLPYKQPQTFKITVGLLNKVEEHNMQYTHLKLVTVTEEYLF